MVEYSPHQPRVKGSIPAATAGRENGGKVGEVSDGGKHSSLQRNGIYYYHKKVSKYRLLGRSTAETERQRDKKTEIQREKEEE